MKAIFISNYFNHHQQPFSDAMFKETEGQYIFLSTEPVEEERIKLGWQKDGFPDYVHYVNMKDDEETKKWGDIICDTDIVIAGTNYYRLLKKRLWRHKITFLYSERLYKSELRLLKLPIHTFRAFQQRECYMLCASAYTAYDYSLSGCFRNRCYKWGYFPALRYYNDVKSFVENKNNDETISMLWVARFIDWKHPELPIRIAKQLKAEGVAFKLTMIGTGPLEHPMRKLIHRYDLQKEIIIRGSMQPSQVRNEMEKSSIFLMTSDRNEGWGAVLNESMNSGCAVICNKQAGSVPYLVNNKENGLIYSNNNFDELYECVKNLVTNRQFRVSMGINAYETIRNVWNAQTACQNIIHLVESLNHNLETTILTGPCSIAENYK